MRERSGRASTFSWRKAGVRKRSCSSHCGCSRARVRPSHWRLVTTAAVMFAIVGITFVFYAQKNHSASVNFREGLQRGTIANAPDIAGDYLFKFAVGQLRPGGDLLVKVFQGAGLAEFQREMAGHFTKVYVRKPKSSRDRSRETFLVGKGLRA